MRPAFIHTVEIAGETWTFYRVAADQPYAEVQAQRGERRQRERPNAWINTQYAVVGVDHAPDCQRRASCGGTTLDDSCTCGREVQDPLRSELIAAATEFQRLRFEAEERAEARRENAHRAIQIRRSAPAPAGNPATTWLGPASMDAEDSIF